MPSDRPPKRDPLAEVLGVEYDPRSEAERAADTLQQYHDWQRSKNQQSPQRTSVSIPQPEFASPMHSRDRIFWIITLWAFSVGGAFAVACYVARASNQMRLRFAAPGMALGALAMASATIYALKTHMPKPPWRPGRLLIGAVISMALLTWALIGWQTWMWFHPPIPPASSVQKSYTQAQQDEAIAKAKQDQLEQDKKDAAQQSADAISKATAALRAQIAQLQSETPISVDKVPTSLRVLFNSDGTYTQLDQKNVAAWEPVIQRDGGGFFGRPAPVISFVIVFKKPIAFDDVQIDSHNTGMIGKATTSDPHFVIVAFNTASPGLVDIAPQNKHGK
jgi:flagellar motor protein MotB